MSLEQNSWTKSLQLDENLQVIVSQFCGSLAEGSIERDHLGAVPAEEIVEFKKLGLHREALSIGPDLRREFVVSQAIVRKVANVDASIAQVVGYHYIWSLTPHFHAGHGRARAVVEELLRRDAFLAGALNPRGGEVVAHRNKDGYMLDGRKTFATGVPVADAVFLEGETAEGAVMGVCLAPDGHVRTAGDWDNMGQRLTASGSVEIEAAPIESSMILECPDLPPVGAQGTLDAPTKQLTFASMYLGIAEGAFNSAVEFVRRHGRPWPPYRSQAADPHICREIGIIAADIAATEALVDRALSRARDSIFIDVGAVTEAVRTRFMTDVWMARIAASRTVIDVTNRVFEIVRARATAREFGFDIPWRNARTHTLHDPTHLKEEELGRTLLTGDAPEPGPYT